MWVIASVFMVGILGTPAAPQSQNEAGRHLVQLGMKAMGGEELVRNLGTIEIKGIGHRYALEQSERPEGPWIVSYMQLTEVRDFAQLRARQDVQVRGLDGTEFWKSAEWSAPRAEVFAPDSAAIFANERYFPASMNSLQDEMDSLALGPERVLVTASSAADLHSEPDVMMHGYPHHVAAFTWQSEAVRVFFSAYTNLPAAVEVTRPHPYDVFAGPWGDVTTRATFTTWLLEPNGLRLPRQWTYQINGQPEHTLTVNEINFHPSVPDNALTFPDDVKSVFMARRTLIDDLPLGRPNAPAIQVAPGIVQIPASWNTAEVRQSDGIVIIEGPIANGYSAKVIEDAQKRFPGLPIKAVITTSDAWPHIGGLREYAARGIPIYALDLNKPILERLMASPHRMAPDALARSGRQAKFTFVSKRMTLGAGVNRVELIPLRTTTGERGMAVYFPEGKLLYGSDLFQRSRGEFFLPQFLTEIADVVEREKLDVLKVFCMHLEPTPWSDIIGSIAKYAAANK
jgi:hypothetical protein